MGSSFLRLMLFQGRREAKLLMNLTSMHLHFNHILNPVVTSRKQETK